MEGESVMVSMARQAVIDLHARVDFDRLCRHHPGVPARKSSGALQGAEMALFRVVQSALVLGTMSWRKYHQKCPPT